MRNQRPVALPGFEGRFHARRTICLVPVGLETGIRPKPQMDTRRTTLLAPTRKRPPSPGPRHLPSGPTLIKASGGLPGELLLSAQLPLVISYGTGRGARGGACDATHTIAWVGAWTRSGEWEELGEMKGRGQPRVGPSKQGCSGGQTFTNREARFHS